MKDYESDFSYDPHAPSWDEVVGEGESISLEPCRVDDNGYECGYDEGSELFVVFVVLMLVTFGSLVLPVLIEALVGAL